MAEQLLKLKVSGMTCDHCAESVLRGIHSVPGVTFGDVSVAKGQAEIRFDDTQASMVDFVQAIEAEGYGASEA